MKSTLMHTHTSRQANLLARSVPNRSAPVPGLPSLPAGPLQLRRRGIREGQGHLQLGRAVIRPPESKPIRCIPMAFLELLADEQAEIINGGSHYKPSKHKCYPPAPKYPCHKPYFPGGWGSISNVTTTVEALALNIATATASGAGSVAMAGNQSATIGISIGA